MTTKKIMIEGYFKGSGDAAKYPLPNLLKSISDLPDKCGAYQPISKDLYLEFKKKLKHLEKSTRYDAFKGSSVCRVCGCRNGSVEFYIDHYDRIVGDVQIRWPDGYKHYLDEHLLYPSNWFFNFVMYREPVEDRFVYEKFYMSPDCEVKQKEDLQKSLENLAKRYTPENIKNTQDEFNEKFRKIKIEQLVNSMVTYPIFDPVLVRKFAEFSDEQRNTIFKDLKIAFKSKKYHRPEELKEVLVLSISNGKLETLLEVIEKTND